jgi:monoamine oxidase
VSAEGTSDIVVIGAGAAGIAAARILHSAGRDVTILEARDRVGGRVWTTFDLATFPVELGAEYVHGEHVATWRWLEELGLDSFDDRRDDEAWWAFADGKLLDPQGFAALMPSHPFDDLWEAASAWGSAPATMETALRLWAQKNRAPQLETAWGLWNTAACISGATDLDQLGSDGLQEATYAGDGNTNFRVRSGYGSIFERTASLLEIRLSTPVTRVEWGARGAIVHSGSLAFACEHVVITLPLGVLKAGVIHFDPPLPQWKLAAVERLGVGHVDKVILVFDAPFWPKDMGALFTDLDTQSWIVPGWGRVEHAPVLRALMGGRAAERFEASVDPVAKAVRELEAVFQVELAGRLREGRFINWGNDPWSRMGYSFVPMGGAGLRAALSEPIGRTLHFAGEATHVVRPCSVHGAIESGERAVAELLKQS